MSLIQVSSSQFNPKAQSGVNKQEDLGNTGSRFSSRFNSVLKIPPYSKIGLSQAIFTVDQDSNEIKMTDFKTEDRNDPAISLYYGGFKDNEFGTFYDNFKFYDQFKNFTPVEIPLVAYSLEGDFKTVNDFWTSTIPQLNLTSHPELQESFTTNTVISGNIAQQEFISTKNLLSVTTGVDISRPLESNLTILSNEELGESYNGIVFDFGIVSDDFRASKISEMEVNTDGAGNITSFEQKFINANQTAPPAQNGSFWDVCAMAQTSFNGFHDAGGYIQMDQFSSSYSVVQPSFGTPFRYDSDYSRRVFTFGLERWKSQQINDDNIQNPSFYSECEKAVENKIAGTGDATLAPYHYANVLWKKRFLQVGNISQYFIAVVPMLEVNSDPVKPSFNFNNDAAPQKGGVPMTLIIGGIEKGERMLFTDQGSGGLNDDPTEFITGASNRLVIYATGDIIASSLYGVNYSGFLDSTNVPLPTDTAAQQANRFYNIPSTSVPILVQNMGGFSLYNRQNTSLQDDSFLRGLRIYNDGYKIRFFRMYMQGTAGNSEELQEILCVRAGQALDWVDTPQAKMTRIDAIVNQAMYPLQVRVSTSSINPTGNSGEKVEGIKYVPISKAPATDCLDLVNDFDGNLNISKLSTYIQKNMIIPACIYNRDYVEVCTPIINFYPVQSDITKPFLSENRKPNVRDLVIDGSGTALNPFIQRIQSNVNIVIGHNLITDTVEILPQTMLTKNPFLRPNIYNIVKFTPSVATELKIIQLRADTSDPSTNYEVATGNYEYKASLADPSTVGIYVHIEDLAIKSSMGSMCQAQTKLVACINKVDQFQNIRSSNTKSSNVYSWNAYEILYIDLHNPDTLELSEIRIRLTDRYMNNIDDISNTQLIFYVKPLDSTDITFKKTKGVKLFEVA